MAKRLNPRAAAAKLSWQIIDKGQSLDAALNDYFSSNTEEHRSLVQELVYGVCRWYGELDAVADKLLDKPIRNKDRVIHFVLLIGLYQLRFLHTADHAAVSETVSACQQLGKGWAKNLINGCLRRWQRESQDLTPPSTSLHERTHPQWLRESISAAWPEHATAILEANDQRPPMVLRVNQQLTDRKQYLDLLDKAGVEASADLRSPTAIKLTHPVPVTQLPEFDTGKVSVQDIAAQCAIDLVTVNDNMRVLDACAAPGGKAAHLLEKSGNAISLDALDISPARVERMRDTFSRLNLTANVFVANAADASTWPHPAGGYKLIIIDAPCSGSGVIRRHPDIKHHRRPEDIHALTNAQQELLNSLWPLLQNDGQLLYLTCSILPPENEHQIEQFLQIHANAQAIELDHPNCLSLAHGKQTLPGVHDMDGFYYCLLRKMSA